MPPNTVYVGRPTFWGNPFTPKDKEWEGEVVEAKTLVMLYELMLHIAFLDADKDTLNKFKEALKTLRGKNLACWCPLDQPCHADVLLKLANK